MRANLHPRASEWASPGVWTRSELADASFSPSLFALTSFGEDADGELYFTLEDEVYRLRPGPAVPTVSPLGLALLVLGLAAASARLYQRLEKKSNAVESEWHV